LRVVAGVAAILQFIFAGTEIFGWGGCFVALAAPSWVDHQAAKDLAPQFRLNIEWAGKLAHNMGVYNLAMAIGLAWLAFGGKTHANPLGIFLAIWLLLAAAGAGLTEVYGALVIQVGLGLVLLRVSVAETTKRSA